MPTNETSPTGTAHFDAATIAAALEALLAAVPTGPLGAISLTEPKRRRLWKDIQEAIERLNAFAVDLDLVALPPLIYNPADPDTFAESIGNKLLLQTPTPLAEISGRKFYGSGVYALFYRGDFDVYRPIKGTLAPIYVGKANPAKKKRSAAERGGPASPRQQGLALWSRLREHADSIRETNSLNIADFDCRYLVTATGWQVAAEAHLISLFKPLWNKESRILMGIGKHGDDPATRGNARSLWDTLHPGRQWATHEGNVPNEKTVEQIKANVAEHYRNHPPRP